MTSQWEEVGRGMVSVPLVAFESGCCFFTSVLLLQLSPNVFTSFFLLFSFVLSVVLRPGS